MSDCPCPCHISGDSCTFCLADPDHDDDPEEDGP